MILVSPKGGWTFLSLIFIFIFYIAFKRYQKQSSCRIIFYRWFLILLKYFLSWPHTACDFSTRLLDIEPEVLKITMPEELVEWYRLHGADSTEVTPKAGMIIMAELADRALINTVQWAKKVPGKSSLLSYYSQAFKAIDTNGCIVKDKSILTSCIST